MENTSATSKCFEAIRIAMEAMEPLDHTQREFALIMICKGLGIPVSTVANETTDVIEKKTNGVSKNIESMTPKDFLREKKNPTRTWNG